jgi:hypothetical protein
VVLAKAGGAGEGPYPWAYPASGNIKSGTGKTGSGAVCASGTPQWDSPYAPPCLPKFTGSNGGATYNGVTGSQILLSRREFPSSANGAQIAAQAKQEGYALPQVTDQVMNVFLNYFNKVYELYGRKVVVEPYTSGSNYTAELLNGNQAQACADADAIAHQMKAFGDVGFGDDFEGGGTGVFAQCAAQQKLVEFEGAGYYNEAYYQSLNPYVWNNVQECQRIAEMSAEVYGTLLANKPASYAGDASLQHQTRKFGTYVPGLPQYESCTNEFKQAMEQKYHVSPAAINTEFTYNLDISTFQTQAQQAIVQFKAAGVTTVITACDSFSLSLLTKAAAAQNYHPEWLLNGVAGDDTDAVAQTYDQPEIQGHLFGLSEAAPQNTFFGPSSPAGILYRKLTGHQIPPGTDGDYQYLVAIFNQLQAAGPDLTPANLARGTHALPTLGAPDYVYGKWEYNTGPSGKPGTGDHTAIIDDRFVYWNGKATSPVNGSKGTFIPLFGGARYSLGDWPSSLPKLFTASGSAAT